MPTLHDRVVKLEERVDKHDERLDNVEAWLTDEGKLREIAEKRVALLEEADAIHERRLRDLNERTKTSAK